jgi:ribulose-5-phosphate 4-epimerase/fuculose-1-phosphate aldolase
MKKKMKSPREVLQAKDLVARATRILFHENLADYHGHVSARIPGTRTLLIKPFLTPLNTIQARHILTVDMDEYLAFKASRPDKAESFAKEVQKAPRETILHLAVYEARPDVFSVVHTHQSLALAFSIAGVPLVPVFFGGARYAPKTPILENPRIVDTIEMAREAAAALGESSALLLRHHGVVVVGKTVEEATAGAVYLERNAYLQLVATHLGNPAPMPDQFTAEHAANMNKRADVSFAYFESLCPKKR